MSLPKFGITKQAHVEHLLTEAAGIVAATLERIRVSRRMKVAEREALSRQLAGVVSTAEIVRLWLGAGAPK